MGRWEKVRCFGPRGWGLPYVIDRGRAQQAPRLLPYAGEEWWRSPDGLWVPTIAGGGFSSATYPRLVAGLSTLSVGLVALGSSYSWGSGAALAARIILPAARTINALYGFINNYTGTASSVTSLIWEIRKGTYATPTNGGGDLVANGTVNPYAQQASFGWINITGLSTVLDANQHYWLILGGNTGGTNYATFKHTITAGPGAAPPDYADRTSASTSNGWSTLLINSQMALMVIAWADGVSGAPWTSAANSTSDQNRRGLVMKTVGLTEALKVYGWVTSTASAAYTGIELSAESALPGTYLAQSTQLVYGSGAPLGAIFATPYQLARATPYRFVFTFGSNGVLPQLMSIGTGADATLRAAMQGGGDWYWARANGTTDWSNDDVNSFPVMQLIVEDQVQVAGGAGPFPVHLRQ